jgi:hypothetical protein
LGIAPSIEEASQILFNPRLNSFPGVEFPVQAASLIDPAASHSSTCTSA